MLIARASHNYFLSIDADCARSNGVFVREIYRYFRMLEWNAYVRRPALLQEAVSVKARTISAEASYY